MITLIETVLEEGTKVLESRVQYANTDSNDPDSSSIENEGDFSAGYSNLELFAALLLDTNEMGVNIRS